MGEQGGRGELRVALFVSAPHTYVNKAAEAVQRAALFVCPHTCVNREAAVELRVPLFVSAKDRLHNVPFARFSSAALFAPQNAQLSSALQDRLWSRCSPARASPTTSFERATMTGLSAACAVHLPHAQITNAVSKWLAASKAYLSHDTVTRMTQSLAWHCRSHGTIAPLGFLNSPTPPPHSPSTSLQSLPRRHTAKCHVSRQYAQPVFC